MIYIRFCFLRGWLTLLRLYCSCDLVMIPPLANEYIIYKDRLKNGGNELPLALAKQCSATGEIYD